MDRTESESAPSVYSSLVDKDRMEPAETEEPVAGPSGVHLAQSPASHSDSLQCMALDSDFSDVDEDFSVSLKSGHHVRKTEVGPLLRAGKVPVSTG